MFVAFEGIDGSGKTTVSNRVAEAIRSSGISVTHLRAEGKFVSAVSEAIRELGRDSKNLELVPEAEFLLYVARDVQLIRQALRPALARGDLVIADRFLFTAEVLGRYGRHLPNEYTAPVLEAAAGGIRPDLVILVDVDPTLARARRKAFKQEVLDRRPPSRKGLAGVGLQHRVRRGYLELAAADPERWVVVENEDSLEETVARVTELVRSARVEGAATAAARYREDRASRSVSGPIALADVCQAYEAFMRWIDARLEREPRVAAYMLSGLYGPGVDERRRVLSDRVPRAVLSAASGLLDDFSWQLRERFAAEYPAAVAQTLAGVPAEEPRAAALRERLAEVAPREIVASIARQDHPDAWRLRERFFASYAEEVVGGLAGLDTMSAWAMRERWLMDTRDARGTSYELCRTAARSVSGLGGERAWAIRQEALVLAPVAALSSLGSLTDAPSWALRRRYLTLASKVVMATLKELRSPEAFEMRRAVADDCKEALDSIQALDDEEAWALREQHADRWISTVVKTLGPLADTQRGKALIRRQLEAYPGNVSLLKHAAAVSLGVHRATDPGDD